MNTSKLDIPRIIGGLILVIIAVLLYVFARENFSVPGTIAIFALGLVILVSSRRNE